MADGSNAKRTSAVPLPPPYSSPGMTPGLGGASHLPSIFTPPAVMHAPQPPSTIHFGPTPATRLQLPYAYYDPHSDYSVSMADQRARSRFIGAVLYALLILALVGTVLGCWGDTWREGYGA
ncbi:hypothetical protein CYLTODRAFT_487489 [Cylindrobasidium torrendii FP15055 ss-10]|uniref:Transmembrane protein n=1 Tax=Cylindrobasidium torrendii FP15055 ss-10 TaxID=1314674 RepID=A0A0D7BLU0_9AGAR|nr:hypothetical protein CYLTODRAFT_487489 [Cylindrobasidium torrendii FP15055 ss-10]